MVSGMSDRDQSSTPDRGERWVAGPVGLALFLAALGYAKAQGDLPWSMIALSALVAGAILGCLVVVGCLVERAIGVHRGQEAGDQDP